MSFLTEAAARCVGAIANMTSPLTRTLAVSGARTFTSSMAARKSAADTVKDGLKTVDRAVSDKLVDGINAGANVANKVKQATGDAVQGEPSASAAELRGEAKGKAAELKGEVKGAAHQAAGKVKGAADRAQKNM